MAYKQLPIVREEYATTKYANQIKDNFDAIVGGQTLRESLTQLSNRLNTVSGQFVQFNEEMQRLITEFNSLRADINRALDNIDLRFEQLSADVIKKITTVSDNLKRLENSTGYNTNLHQYFKNVDQARNLVLAINKLHEDVGDPRNLTTRIKENTVSAINELDMEVGNLSSLTTTEKRTIVGAINELDRDVGNVGSITDGEISASNLSDIIKRMKTLLGNFNSINSAIRRDNFVNSINNLYSVLLNKIDSITLRSGKNTNISSSKNIDVLGGVSKDYTTGTNYYKNDFVWNDSILYKAKRDFTSTNFGADLNTNLEEIKTGSDLSTSKVVNAYDRETVFEPGDLVLVTEDSNGSNTSAVITAKQVSYDNAVTSLAAENVQDAIDKILNEKVKGLQNNINTINKKIETTALINLIVPVGCTYIQFDDGSGDFLRAESPSNLFPNTVWQLLYNTESIFLRTEGSLSEDRRMYGIQGDAGRNATGRISGGYADGGPMGSFMSSSGVFNSTTTHNISITHRTDRDAYVNSLFDLSRAYTTANEFRTRNRLIRMYKRIS